MVPVFLCFSSDLAGLSVTYTKFLTWFDPDLTGFDPQLTPSGPPVTNSDFSFLLRVTSHWGGFMRGLCHSLVVLRVSIHCVGWVMYGCQ